jgi:hypothetical protein
MTALSASRARTEENWTRQSFTLASGKIAYKGGAACLRLSTGKVEPADDGPAGGADLRHIGVFHETIDASAADAAVTVNLVRELWLEWWANSAATAVSAIGGLCYFEDDQTVSADPADGCVAGRVWSVSATYGVLVEKLSTPPGAALETASFGAFASNDLVIPANPPSGAVVDIPTTGAASTVTLPAVAVEGTEITFVADGTKNGHTVQYRDATGPVNLTTALTASKRHLVKCVHKDDLWYANAYVSP